MSFRLMMAAVVVGCAGGVAGAQDRVESALCRASVVGEVETGDRVQDLLVHQAYMYALVGESIQIFDLQDPADPLLLSSMDLGFYGRKLWLHERRLYVAGKEDVLVFDASDAEHLVELYRHDIGYTDAWRFEFVGHRLFMAGDFLGLLSFDFTDLKNPVRSEVAAASPGVGFSVLEVIGSGLVYGTSFGCDVYDISASDEIVAVSELDLYLSAQRYSAGGNLFFVMGSDEVSDDYGLVSYDVSDPAQPQRLSFLPVQGDRLEYLPELEVVICSGGPTLEVVDVSDPMDMSWVGSYPDSSWFGASVSYGGNLYITPPDSIRVIDLERVSKPWVGGFVTGNIPVRVEVEGAYAYALNTYRGVGTQSSLEVFDVSDPENPNLVDREAIFGFSRDFVVRWPNVYCANQYVGISIHDVSDPANIRTRSTLNLVGSYSGNTSDITLSGDYAYVANQHRLVIVDVSDPDAPAIVDELMFGAQCVHADGDWLFVITQADELFVLDITDPTTPDFVMGVEIHRIGINPSDNHPRELEVVGDRLFVSMNYPGILEFAIEPSGHIALVETHQVGSSDTSLLVRDGMVYTPSSDAGMVYRMDADGSLSFASSLSVSGPVIDIDVEDGYAYIVGGTGELSYSMGLSVIDVQRGCGICPADLNGDGVLNYFDAAALMAAFGAGDLSADLNGDGSIDFLDVSAFLDAYGDGCP